MKSNWKNSGAAVRGGMVRGLFIAGLSCISFLADCRLQAIVPDAEKLHYADVVKAAEDHDQVILWEGLPSDFSEETSYANELATKKTFTIGTRTFYARAIPLKDEEAVDLSNLVLLQKENFRPWSGLKLCGGFHADYAIEWRARGVTLAQALVCFSCHEVEFHVGNRTEVVDQSAEGNRRLFAALHLYRQERPPFRLARSSARQPAAP